MVVAAAPPALQSAATITDARPAPTAQPDDKNTLTSALEADVKVPPDALKTALSAKPTAPPPTKPKPATQLTKPTKQEQERTKPSAPASPHKTTPIDNDVDLLSALVTHSGGQPDTKPTQSTKKQAANTASPDIVERRSGDSTAALLKRCKRLGGTEAKLCSRRICSGHASEAACKAK